MCLPFTNGWAKRLDLEYTGWPAYIGEGEVKIWEGLNFSRFPLNAFVRQKDFSMWTFLNPSCLHMRISVCMPFCIYMYACIVVYIFKSTVCAVPAMRMCTVVCVYELHIELSVYLPVLTLTCLSTSTLSDLPP